MIIRLLLLCFIILILPEKSMAKTQYYEDGLKFFKKQKFEEAKFKFEQDIVYNPKNELSYLYLSKIFNNLEKKELEEQNLKTVILLNPKNEEAIFNLAKLKLSQSDFKESENLVKKLLTFCKNYCQKSKTLKLEIENSLKK